MSKCGLAVAYVLFRWDFIVHSLIQIRPQNSSCKTTRAYFYLCEITEAPAVGGGREVLGGGGGRRGRRDGTWTVAGWVCPGSKVCICNVYVPLLTWQGVLVSLVMAFVSDVWRTLLSVSTKLSSWTFQVVPISKNPLLLLLVPSHLSHFFAGCKRGPRLVFVHDYTGSSLCFCMYVRPPSQWLTGWRALANQRLRTDTPPYTTRGLSKYHFKFV